MRLPIIAKQQWEAAASPIDKALLIVQEALPRAWEMTKSAVAEGSGAAGGQILGRRISKPLRVPKIIGQSVGGATGAAVGDFIAQQNAMAYDPNLEYKIWTNSSRSLPRIIASARAEEKCFN